ncbi:hypothetical protein Sjap_024551 [Stephania japonica]|uniref:Uncharacterized protein n=1 Tax=Stephania japonica TaxID=461633 RepID=A0AAP0EM88_9MAGN
MDAVAIGSIGDRTAERVWFGDRVSFRCCFLRCQGRRREDEKTRDSDLVSTGEKRGLRLVSAFAVAPLCISKKFIQLVEEKKKRALEKNEACLQWEQKLEGAGKAKAGVEAKGRKLKAGVKHRKKRSASDSYSESDSDSSSGEERHVKENVRDTGNTITLIHRQIMRRGRRNIGEDSGNSPQALVMGTVVMKRFTRRSQRKKQAHKRRHKHRHRHSSPDSSASHSSGNELDVKRRIHKARHHKRHRHSSAGDSSSLDSDDDRHNGRSRSLGKSSDDNHDEKLRNKKHHHRHRHHHHHPHHRNNYHCKDDQIVNVSSKPAEQNGNKGNATETDL